MAKRRQPEWSLQRAVKRFVSRAVAQPHVFACHDRGPAATALAHIGEANRGIVSGWPDTELATPGLTFRCELKAPGGAPTAQQAAVLASLAAMPGHPTAWASTVVGYARQCAAAGVPLLANWEYVAAHEDALVEAPVTAKVGAKRGPPKLRDAGHARRVEKIRGRVLF